MVLYYLCLLSLSDNHVVHPLCDGEQQNGFTRSKNFYIFHLNHVHQSRLGKALKSWSIYVSGMINGGKKWSQADVELLSLLCYIMRREESL